MAKDFFGSKVTMSILEQPEEVERTGKREHVIFLMTQTSKGTQAKEDDDREQREGKGMVMSGRTTCRSRSGVSRGPIFSQQCKSEQLTYYKHIFYSKIYSFSIIFPFQTISFTRFARATRRDCGLMKKPSAMLSLSISCLTKM